MTGVPKQRSFTVFRSRVALLVSRNEDESAEEKIDRIRELRELFLSLSFDRPPDSLQRQA